MRFPCRAGPHGSMLAVARTPASRSSAGRRPGRASPNRRWRRYRSATGCDWCPPPESNRRPHPYQGCALPTELGGPCCKLCPAAPALCGRQARASYACPRTGPSQATGPRIRQRLHAPGAGRPPAPEAVSTPTPAIRLERVAGIEPASSAWKAEVLPLNYTRKPPAREAETLDWPPPRAGHSEAPFDGRAGRRIRCIAASAIGTGGGGRIRTYVGIASRFTVCPR